jgi:hypothetical protein
MKVGKLIKYVTFNRIMPPWKADVHFTQFINQRILSELEINTIKEWVDNGMPKGIKNKDAKEIKSYDKKRKNDEYTNWTVSMPSSYIIPGNNKDITVCIKVPITSSKGRYVHGYVFNSDNLKLVHHAKVHVYKTPATFIHKPDDYAMRVIDGTKEYLDTLNDDNLLFVGPWVPGANNYYFPINAGFELPENGFIIFEIHYAPSPIIVQNKSQVIFKISDKIPNRKIYQYVVGSYGSGIINPQLFVKANTQQTFTVKDTFPSDFSVVALNPHMHYIGQKYKAFAIKPNGDTIPLIMINDWDLNWQEYYRPEKLLKIDSGSVITIIAEMNNTVNNKNNPNYPPKNVIEGLKSTDEMIQLNFMGFYYKKDDELIRNE